MATRWLITGHRGQLGSALVSQLDGDPSCEIAAAVDLPEVDVADPDAVDRLFGELDPAPDIVVNAAAFTHVDRCEREPEAASRANADAPGLLARACRAIDRPLVHVSTDYVFAGDSERPYREDDPPSPQSGYGRTKLEGERRVREVDGAYLIVRTSWVFGRGRNFVAAIVNQARERRAGSAHGPLRVVDDQKGRPTYAVDLASAIRALVAQGARGVYHVANAGVATWWDLARECLDGAGFADLEVERIHTGDLDLDAPRPAYSILDCAKAEAAGVRSRSWQDALAAYLASPESPLEDGATR